MVVKGGFDYLQGTVGRNRTGLSERERLKSEWPRKSAAK
jgi:hypothetical protein